ncbi:MAG: histone deacetylase family protein [Fervidobacterium sp.]|uniref:Acetoin utilization deacetylase AcuC n=1 Tax=Fervidobacterium gondwanense DSM 13020 TaxID=1121883 RepID=A0A1M7TCF6_FERGO|nr:histone deacetylase family protein [Fervidobacterium gondwanense]SHN68449.1 Acetoin utilization deacetylase AcuC [Fervidobacterium gondwanense DSM 13020]
MSCEFVFFSDLNVDFVPRKEIDNGKFVRNPEKPERLTGVLGYLNKKFQSGSVVEFSEEWILKVHTEKYFKYIVKKSQEVSGEYIPEVFFVDLIFDTGTPINNLTYIAAKRAVDVALSAAECSFTSGKVTYALTRPPGHHAMRSFGGGYCYFNNVAIAAKFFEEKGMKVAILDVDFHHGNGTQDIFYADPNVLYVSLHGDPKEFYPWYSGFEDEIGEGKGRGKNINIPLPRGTDGRIYFEALRKALEKIQEFSPDVFLLSLGTDTHVKDPVGKFSLKSEDYKIAGRLIADATSKVKYKVLVHEGGYNHYSNLSAVKNFLEGFLS